ncbi:MAG TPA: heme ABC exporter ATP-binding protein CcmA, partial [Dehalococcoidia bacterium]|nr:heme ABC exporter ATP-binding protein CcmA [Dehalococcoidia bacterium]
VGSPWAIEASGLGKAYGPAVALRRVDVRVGWNERVVLIGPNGAGKTTLLRLLAVLQRPTVGRLRLAGRETEGGAIPRHLIGFVGHSSALYPDLTATENLAFYARLYRLSGAGPQIEEAIGRVGLGDRRDVRARALSRGQQQRLALARALLHDPPILILDEPDTGLDAAGLDLLAELLAESGRTVLLSTHHPEWAERFATREIALAGGRIVRDDPIGLGKVDDPLPAAGAGTPRSHANAEPPGRISRPESAATAFLAQVWAVLWKDLVLEARRRELIGTMLIFTLLVIVVFTFALDLAAEYAPIVAPGALWVAYIFAGTLGIGRGFSAEVDTGTLEGLLLAPVPRGAIYLAKLLGNALLMLAVEAASLPVVVAFFNQPVVQAPLLPVFLLGSLGVAAVTTLFAALAANTRAREVLLPVLLFPVVTPVVIASVQATTGILTGAGVGPWPSILVAFAAIFGAVAYLVFEYVVEE